MSFRDNETSLRFPLEGNPLPDCSTESSTIRRLQILRSESKLSTDRTSVITEALVSGEFKVEVRIAVMLEETPANANNPMSRLELIRYVNSTPLIDYFGESHTCTLARSRILLTFPT